MLPSKRKYPLAEQHVMIDPEYVILPAVWRATELNRCDISSSAPRCLPR
jgi:hypothetical protein